MRILRARISQFLALKKWLASSIRTIPDTSLSSSKRSSSAAVRTTSVHRAIVTVWRTMRPARQRVAPASAALTLSKTTSCGSVCCRRRKKLLTGRAATVRSHSALRSTVNASRQVWSAPRSATVPTAIMTINTSTNTVEWTLNEIISWRWWWDLISHLTTHPIFFMEY